MQQPSRLALRLAAGLVSLALAGGWAANAQAQGIAYAFGQETISGVTITPTTTLVSGVQLPANLDPHQVFTQCGDRTLRSV